jgi:hypothetical protein
MFYTNLPNMMLVNWQVTRETTTRPRTIERSKMRLIEKYALMCVQAQSGAYTPMAGNEAAVYYIAADILTSRNQVVGEFLQNLLETATTFIRDHRIANVNPIDKVEDVFKYLTNYEDGVLTKVSGEGCSFLLNDMIQTTRAYCISMNINLAATVNVTVHGQRLGSTPAPAAAPTEPHPAAAPSPAPIVPISDAARARGDRAAFLARFDAPAQAPGNSQSGAPKPNPNPNV